MTEAEFPVESFREAAPHLRRPFTSAAVKFKVQATWPGGALIVSYIDARLVIERLNLIVPHLWSDTYTAVGGKQMWCHLTVDGITRHDVGEGEGKGLVSDALKRAGVKFGIGVSLYAVPSMMLNDDMLKRKTKKQRDGKDKEEVTLTDRGEKHVRGLYEAWLKDHGREAFGEPLSHGDVEGAQGDHEAESPVPAEEPATEPRPVPMPVSDVPAEDVWWHGSIKPLLAQVKPDGKAIREAVEVAQGAPLGNVGSWEIAITRLTAGKQRDTFRDWLTQKASEDTPMADEAKGATA